MSADKKIEISESDYLKYREVYKWVNQFIENSLDHAQKEAILSLLVEKRKLETKLRELEAEVADV